MTETNGGKVTQKDLYDNINALRSEMKIEFHDLKECFVTKDEFEPIKRFVNGATGIITLIVIGILGVILATVIPGFRL
jgi:hypothetical protein